MDDLTTQIGLLYLPALQNIFATAPLSLGQWLALLICAPLILLADELRKKIVRTKLKTTQAIKMQPRQSQAKSGQPYISR